LLQASKFALNGFSQSLAMEVHTRGIKVCVCFPPDTDTPLLAEENKTKPAITKMLSESTTMVSADSVADAAVSGMVRGSPLIGIGFDGWMLATLTAGMTPVSSYFMGAIEVLTLSIWRLVGIGYVSYFYFLIGRNDKPGAKQASAQSTAQDGSSGTAAPASGKGRGKGKQAGAAVRAS
jgi:3-dehydrosphinganine reductase